MFIYENGNFNFGRIKRKFDNIEQDTKEGFIQGLPLVDSEFWEDIKEDKEVYDKIHQEINDCLK